MSEQLTEQQARVELGKLDLSELIELGNAQGLPTGDATKDSLIEMLLGNCGGCKKKD